MNIYGKISLMLALLIFITVLLAVYCLYRLVFTQIKPLPYFSDIVQKTHQTCMPAAQFRLFCLYMFLFALWQCFWGVSGGPVAVQADTTDSRGYGMKSPAAMVLECAAGPKPKNS